MPFSSHIKSTYYWYDFISDVVNLDHLTGASVCFLHCKATLLFLSFCTVLWKRVTRRSPHLLSDELRSTPFEVEYLYKFHCSNCSALVICSSFSLLLYPFLLTSSLGYACVWILYFWQHKMLQVRLLCNASVVWSFFKGTVVLFVGKWH